MPDIDHHGQLGHLHRRHGLADQQPPLFDNHEDHQKQDGQGHDRDGELHPVPVRKPRCNKQTREADEQPYDLAPEIVGRVVVHPVAQVGRRAIDHHQPQGNNRQGGGQ